ncbi:hypothetical protein MHBO_000162 [Bonamia ostreae]|uniref:Phosphatidylinositol transfer protein N-terminal domain-containing protein n=1 Tax=Bonamia ostreae TaxID=126728 RepID=A0ABV2AER1_9EUKA
MRTVLFKIPLPMTVDEYNIAQLYMVLKRSERDTIDGEGVKVLKNEPFENEEHGKGQFTEKCIYISKKIPSFAKKLFPSLNSTRTLESSYNCYPYCFTEYKTVLF